MVWETLTRAARVQQDDSAVLVGLLREPVGIEIWLYRVLEALRTGEVEEDV